MKFNGISNAKKLVAFLLLLILAAACATEEKPEKVGKERNTSSTHMTSLTGEEISLADYRGKVVLVNYWATWCMPCVKEIPDLVKLYNDYKGNDFEIIGIYVNSPAPQVEKMVKDLGINYTIVQENPRVTAQFGEITSIPRTFILDRDGNIVEDLVGMRNYQTFETMIKKYLREKS
jgi:thiol-disulfide isomerase/thioredoxin